MLTRFLTALSVGVALSVGAAPVANAQIAEVAAAGALILGKELASYYLADLVLDPLNGKPDTKELARRLDYLAEANAQHAADIYELKKQVANSATRDEVRAAILAVLKKVDAKFAEHAARIYELEVARKEIERKQADMYAQLGTTRADLNRLAGRVGQIAATVENQGRRLTGVEAELAELKRWDNAEMSMRLAVAGSDRLAKGDYPEAIRLLTHAHGYAPEDPGVPYVLGIASHLAGKDQDADLWIAKGIVAERTKVPGEWFKNTLPRYQGRLRTWFDGRRYDPVLGTKSSGTIRVIEFNTTGAVALPPSQ